MNKDDKIFIAGHNGMVGSSILKNLQDRNYPNLIVADKGRIDLRNRELVDEFFAEHKPNQVILAAAKVGGINANMKFPADFIFDNLAIQNSIFSAAEKNGTEKIVFLGSSCLYPKECKQPMKEEYMMTGPLEPTNEGYAIAKLAGVSMAKAYYEQHGIKYVSLIPCNLYGPNDSFDLEHSHVLSALVRKFSDAKKNGDSDVSVWGTGIAKREFLHVQDMAEAVVFLMENDVEDDMINIGWGEEISIKELAEMIRDKVGFEGELKWDTSKPDGMLRKCMDVEKMKAYGFSPKVSLSEGVDEMIEIYAGMQTANQ
ncbi:MAG: GDP-L-fucose synthase [Flavobacteriales bacterium]|nr:GDP-L-fucose synthase [Flavobacteriales bacterium]